MCVNYFSGVDRGTLDQGASLLTSNRLSSVMDSQSRNKGIPCCCFYFFAVFFMHFYFIFYWLLVAVIYKGPINLLIVDIELELVKYSVVPIGHWLFFTCYIVKTGIPVPESCSDLGTRDSYNLCNFVSQA